MQLSSEHLEDLSKSGLTEDVIKEAKIHSALPSDINKIFGRDVKIKSLLAFSYPGCKGFTRYKLFPPYKQRDGHTMRYFQPKESGLHLYIPPKFNPDENTIRIVEGEKKALKGSQEGLNVLGLGGIWNFALKGADGKPQLIDDFTLINWTGKKVELIPDADFLQKTEVCHAVYRLGRLLEQKGAKINVVVLPLDGSRSKLDDYLVNHSKEEFEALERIQLTNNIFNEVAKKEPLNLMGCVINLPSLLKMEIPERPKLFPWLPQGGLGMVYGPRGIGKTFFSLSFAISLATGTPFLKWEAPPPTGVLLVDGEMPISQLRERAVDLLSCEPKKPLQLLSGEEVFAKIQKDLNLVNPDFQSALLELLDNEPEIKAIIIDNISCLFMGLKESDKGDWEKVIPWLLQLRRRNIAVLLVHHSGKSGDQRGTSGREDMLDTVIKLSEVKDDQIEGAKFIVSFSKSRGAYGKEIEEFEAVLDLDVEGCWTWKPLEESTYERMLKLAKDGVDNVTDMAEDLGVTKGLVSNLKKKGIKEEILVNSKQLIINDGCESKSLPF